MYFKLSHQAIAAAYHAGKKAGTINQHNAINPLPPTWRRVVEGAVEPMDLDSQEYGEQAELKYDDTVISFFTVRVSVAPTQYGVWLEGQDGIRLGRSSKKVRLPS